jgi:hypothetical protein
MTQRNAKGHWLPGQSANPGGRPRDELRLAELARAYTEEAVATLVDIMRTGEPSDRVRAATALLDRGYGKPAQEARLTVETVDLGQLHLQAVRELSKPPPPVLDVEPVSVALPPARESCNAV